MRKREPLKSLDYEKLGYETMRETRSETRAKEICGLHVHALADELQPEILSRQREIQEKQARGQALCAQLYERPTPVSDVAMVGLSIALVFLVIMFFVAFTASAVSHSLTFILFGWSTLLSVVIGVTLTGVATAVGHRVFEKVLLRRPVLEGLVAAAGFALLFWGLFQLAEARGNMASVVVASEQTDSFVDDPAAPESTPTSPEKLEESTQEKVRRLLGDAVVKIMLAADLMVGMLGGLITTIRSGDDFAAWRHLRRLKRQLARLDESCNKLVSIFEAAKKKCMAGLLRAKHFEGATHVPYFRMLPAILLFVLGATSTALAQTDIRRHEAVLVDVSGSVAKKSQTSTLFREYLFGIRQLLQTEPPNTRVWVQVITTDSFGAVQTIVKGWTPSMQGVFTDDIDRARRQLVAGFESKSRGLRPVAAGTDITGGLWRAKATIEAGYGDATLKRLTKDIFILSDMLNETADFNMPALLPTGPEQMLDYATKNNLVVPLVGYRVHVYGASTAGLSPEMWNCMKTFWTLYFRAAGAELVIYSTEVTVDRH